LHAFQLQHPAYFRDARGARFCRIYASGFLRMLPCAAHSCRVLALVPARVPLHTETADDIACFMFWFLQRVLHDAQAQARSLAPMIAAV
jgi:hypothetical protein